MDRMGTTGCALRPSSGSAYSTAAAFAVSPRRRGSAPNTRAMCAHSSQPLSYANVCSCTCPEGGFVTLAVADKLCGCSCCG
eukprot:6192590-Pleurochrysis_carterae.AAC.2